MPLKQNKPSKIHHSDRGSQYTCIDYLDILKEQGVKVSIALTAQDSAYAERINRTLKYEYGLKQTIKNTDLAQKMTQQAVYIYNNLRTHFSLDLRKPAEVHLNPNIKYKSYRKNNVNLPELTI